MTKQKTDKTHKRFLKKLQKETLAIVEQTVKKEDKEEKIIICIINDIAFPESKKKAAEFVQKDKEVNILPLSGLWQAFFEGKYQLANEIITSKVLYDAGLITALKKSMMLTEAVLKKFDKYTVSVVLFGSWARGTAVKSSDTDIGVVIDDTDVRETTAVELKEKIRRIVLGMAAEISKDFNVQTYLLTQFWEYVRDANPVIFTLLRDGVPLVDRGLFSPWKLLLKMGKIKPTPEAIQSFISSGRLLTNMAKSIMNELVTEKLYYAMLNPAQAALMFMGIAPPAYSETPILLKKYFVDKKKLDAKYVVWLDEIIKLRKRVEHDHSKEINGKLLDSYIKRSEDFANAIEKLFEKMRKETIGEKIKEIDYLTNKGMKQVMEAMGIKASDSNLYSKFKHEVLSKKVFASSYTDFLGYLDRIKKDYKKGLVTQEEISRLERTAHDFIEATINFSRTKKTAGTDKFKVKFKYGEKTGELWLLGETAFMIKDMTHPEKDVFKLDIKSDGSFGKPKSATTKDITAQRKKIKVSKVAKIKERTLESLKSIFGKKLEIIIG